MKLKKIKIKFSKKKKNNMYIIVKKFDVCKVDVK